jgi:serine/threonine-protein kinase
LIRLRVLGPIELQDAGGREIRSVIAQPKRLALLVCLVVGPRGFRRRDSLLALLWPELDDARGRAALNQAIRFLRREIEDSSRAVIVSRGAEEVGINPEAIWCDAMVLRDYIEADRYSEALELYRGDLLDGFFAEQGAGFHDWLSRERELLRAAAARAARELASAQERDAQYTPAVAAARRAVQLSEADERLVRELLQLLDRLGDRAGAVQAYEGFARRLALEYDVKPAAETQALIEQIRARVTPAERLVSHRPPGANGSLTDHRPAEPTDGAPGESTQAVKETEQASAVRPWLSVWARRFGLLAAGAAVGALATWLLMS